MKIREYVNDIAGKVPYIRNTLTKEISPRKIGAAAGILAMLTGSGCATVYKSHTDIDSKMAEAISNAFQNRPYIEDTQEPDVCKFVVGLQREGLWPVLVDRFPEGLSQNDELLFEYADGSDLAVGGFVNGQYIIHVRGGVDNAQEEIIRTFFSR